MPDPNQLASIPTITPLSISPISGGSGTVATLSSAMVGTQHTNVPTAPTAGPLVLTLSAQPFPARLVERIISGQFVEMRDLLTDNISLLQHLEQMQPGSSSSQQPTPPPLPSRSSCSHAFRVLTCLHLLSFLLKMFFLLFLLPLFFFLNGANIFCRLHKYWCKLYIINTLKFVHQ